MSTDCSDLIRQVKLLEAAGIMANHSPRYPQIGTKASCHSGCPSGCSVKCFLDILTGRRLLCQEHSKIKKAKDGQTFFHLKAANGQIVLASEMYKAKESALNGIESVKKNSPLAERYEKLTSKNGKFYFTLKAANSQVIGNSEMYESEPLATAESIR